MKKVIILSLVFFILPLLIRAENQDWKIDYCNKESIFVKLANLHENILAIKVDGATKEDYVWGLRVGFVTYNNKTVTKATYSALEAKTAGAIRGNISNVSHLSQSLVLNAFESETYDAEKKEKFGKKASQEQKQELQQFALNAGQQLKQNQALAQQKAQQYKMGLLLSWRQQITPVVDEAARKHNARVVLVASPSLMWFDASIDITSEVIAALRAQPIKAAVSDANVSGDKTETSE